MPLRFSNERKIRKQRRKRGVTEQMIRRALAAPPESWHGKLGAAWRYRDPQSGAVVLVDAATDEIFQLVHRGSDMTTTEVYVALLDEGVSVWRPAPAHHVSGETYVLLRPEDYDLDDEAWEFPPGSVVICRKRQIRDGEILAAVERVAVPNRQSA